MQIIIEVARAAANHGGAILGFGFDAEQANQMILYRSALHAIATTLEVLANQLRDDGDQRYAEFARQAQIAYSALRSSSRTKAGKAYSAELQSIARTVRASRRPRASRPTKPSNTAPNAGPSSTPTPPPTTESAGKEGATTARKS